MKKMITIMVMVVVVFAMAIIAEERTDDIWKNCSYQKSMEIHEMVNQLQETKGDEAKVYAYKLPMSGATVIAWDYTNDHHYAKEYGWY